MCVYCRYKSMVPKAITLLILHASYFVRYYIYRSSFFFYDLSYDTVVVWGLYSFDSNRIFVITLVYDPRSLGHWFPTLSKPLPCLETWGISYSVTRLHIPEERMPPLRSFLHLKSQNNRFFKACAKQLHSDGSIQSCTTIADGVC